jgi:hypothetical protein
MPEWYRVRAWMSPCGVAWPRTDRCARLPSSVVMGVVTGGLSHRAIATRCCCPPDSAAGSRRARPVQADLAQHPDDLGPPGPATGQPQRQGEVLVDVEHRQRVGGLKDEADPSATGAVQVALVQAGQLGGAQETPSRRSAGPGPLRTAAGSTFPIRTAHQRRPTRRPARVPMRVVGKAVEHVGVR